MRSIVVVMGGFMIFLPGWGRGGRSELLYKQLAARKLWPPPRRSMTWDGINHQWPTRPRHTLDLGREA
jgi:hypothetical protein